MHSRPAASPHAPSTAAAPAAAPATAPVGKGVASAKYVWRNPALLSALNVSWTYGWSPWVPASTPSLDSVPMIWGARDAAPATVRALAQGRAQHRYSELLAFNEPDNPNQSDMTPQQAIDLWPLLESTGLALGSPAPADVTDGWLDRFMALAAERHARVDFIALHFYVDFTNPAAVAGIVSAVRAVYAKYGKPIWITEIGALDIRPWGLRMSAAPSDVQAQQFMTQATTAFGALPGILARYAWFTDNCWSSPQERMSSLYDDHDRLTAIGRAFSNVR